MTLRNVVAPALALVGILLPPALAISDCATQLYNELTLALASSVPEDVAMEHATLQTEAMLTIHGLDAELFVFTPVTTLLHGHLR